MRRYCRCCGIGVREPVHWCPLCSSRLVIPWHVHLISWAVIALEAFAIVGIIASW